MIEVAPTELTQLPKNFFDGPAEYPRGVVANVEFRKRILERAAHDEEFQKQVWMKCSRDIFFFLNVFCWTYDPRLDDLGKIPFITYRYQDEAIEELLYCIQNGHDVVIEKSRDMGATWICLAVFFWLWLFRDNRTFLIVSRKEDLVDRTDDPDALMWKVDFLYDLMPEWLTPPLVRNNLHIGNGENGSTMSGESRNGDLGRGGRRTAMFLDEYATFENGASVSAATKDVTNCRIFNSTPKGTGNDHYDKRLMCKHVITLHWTRHPEKARGVYQDAKGKLRSPWYDKQCEERSPVEVAQELDIDYGASGAQFFNQESIDKLKADATAPLVFGEIDFEKETAGNPKFEARKEGRLRLWFYPAVLGHPPRDRTYSIGVDVSTGSGSSDSAISVYDNSTGSKVALWKDNRTDQKALAYIAAAIGNWFTSTDGTKARIMWEGNGPGQLFGKTLIGLDYDNVYRDVDERSITKKVSKRPGWYSTTEKKLLLLSEYRAALESGDIFNPSSEGLKECEYYQFVGAGVEHARAHGSDDPTKKASNHGDEVIADALGCRLFMLHRGIKKPAQKKEEQSSKLSDLMNAPEGSFGNRRYSYLQDLEDDDNWSMN